jgi:hypothetical protein
MHEVKDFPYEITGKTYSPVRPKQEGGGQSIIGSLVAFGKKRLSMVSSKTPPKSPDLELGKSSISNDHFQNDPTSHIQDMWHDGEDEKDNSDDEYGTANGDDEYLANMYSARDKGTEGGSNIGTPLNSETSEIRILSKKHFMKTIKALDKRKQWAEIAIRRFNGTS